MFDLCNFWANSFTTAIFWPKYPKNFSYAQKLHKPNIPVIFRNIAVVISQGPPVLYCKCEAWDSNIELILSKGVLALMDEACLNVGKTTDSMLLEAMDRKLKGNEHYTSRSIDSKENKNLVIGQDFVIRHYAGM